MSTWGDIINQAYGKVGVARAGDVLAPELAELGLRTLNQLIDQWNAQRSTVWADVPYAFVITPSLSPHTIGIAANTPTWTVTGNRPEKITSAAVRLTNVSPYVKRPIDIRDQPWYAAQSVPTLTNDLPTDLYYEPDWPNGNVFLWPVPTTAYTVELWLRIVLSQVALTDTVSLPPGYESALMLTLSELLAPDMGQVSSPETAAAARNARAIIFDANDEIPRIATQAAGMPRKNSGASTTFNYRSRSFR